MTFGVKFDVKDWAEQAEKEGIPGEFINFIIQNHGEIFAFIDQADKNKGMQSMPREWSMFFNSLLNLKGDFKSKEALYQIQQNGKAILRLDYVNMFTQFLQSPDWSLVEPSKIFDMKIKEEDLLEDLIQCVGVMSSKTKPFKAAQSAVLSMRVVNHIIAQTMDAPFSNEMGDRLEFLIKNKIFGEDLSFKVIRDLFASDNTKKYSKLFQRDFFRKALTS